MKAVKAHLQENSPERVEAFEKGAQAFAKKIIGNFKDYEFYVGESMNPDGMVALLNYREDGTTPFVSIRPPVPPHPPPTTPLPPPTPLPPLLHHSSTHPTIPPSSQLFFSFNNASFEQVLTVVHFLERWPAHSEDLSPAVSALLGAEIGTLVNYWRSS